MKVCVCNYENGTRATSDECKVHGGMTSENYVENVLRTDCEYSPETIDRVVKNIRLLHAAMGMVTEAAELMDMLKKHFFYGKPFDKVNAKEELGDSAWYLGLAVDEIRTTMNEIMTLNIAKLKLRYPNKFTEKDAIDRDVKAERVLLESDGERKKLVPDFFKEIFKSEKEVRQEIEANYSHGPCPCGNEEFSMEVDDFGSCIGKCPSKRGQDWLKFSAQVLAHIEEYTTKQYGDKGQDQVTNWSLQERLNQITKYAFRNGKNARDNQDELDLVKMAHYAQLSLNKLKGDV